jgi:hypothetical protein
VGSTHLGTLHATQNDLAGQTWGLPCGQLSGSVPHGSLKVGRPRALPGPQVVDVIVQDRANGSAKNGSEKCADASDQILNGGNNGGDHSNTVLSSARH